MGNIKFRLDKIVYLKLKKVVVTLKNFDGIMK